MSDPMTPAVPDPTVETLTEVLRDLLDKYPLPRYWRERLEPHVLSVDAAHTSPAEHAVGAQIAEVLGEHFVMWHDMPDAEIRGEWRCSFGKKFGFSDSAIDHLAAILAEHTERAVREAEASARTAWDVHAEHVETMNRLHLHDRAVAEEKQAEAVRETLEAAAVRVDERCPHEPDEHAEGCCEVCDFAFAAAATIRDGGPTMSATPEHDGLSEEEREALECAREQRDDLRELLDAEREIHAEALVKAWHEGYGAGSSDATDGWLSPGSPRTTCPYATPPHSTHRRILHPPKQPAPDALRERVEALAAEWEQWSWHFTDVRKPVYKAHADALRALLDDPAAAGRAT